MTLDLGTPWPCLTLVPNTCDKAGFKFILVSRLLNVVSCETTCEIRYAILTGFCVFQKRPQRIHLEFHGGMEKWVNMVTTSRFNQ